MKLYTYTVIIILCGCFQNTRGVWKKNSSPSKREVAAYFESKESQKLVVDPVEWPVKIVYGSNPVSRMFLSPLGGGYLGKQFTRHEGTVANSKDPMVVQKKIKHYEKFYKNVLRMEDFYVPKDGFPTFNDWFTRTFKNIETARPMQSDQCFIVSPADSKLLIIPNLSENTNIIIKERQFNIAKFLMNPVLAKTFEDGVMMIFRLAPYDYHRYHYPFDCTVEPEQYIAGGYHSVNPRAFTAGSKPLTTNKRSYELLKPVNIPYAANHTIAMVQVGATAVASIVNGFMDYKKNRLKAPPNTVYKKGEEMGYFQFGGSTIVLLFPKNSITPDAKIVENSKNGYETAVKVRETIARWKC